MSFVKVSVLACLVLIVAGGTVVSSATASWTLSADQRNGLPALTLGGNTALAADFVFWGKNWAWASISTEFKVIGPFDYAIAGKNKPLNFDLTARARRASARKLSWEFVLDASTTTPDV